MLTDSWVDDEYFVGSDGAMLVNEWRKTYSDEDMDDPDAVSYTHLDVYKRQTMTAMTRW